MRSAHRIVATLAILIVFTGCAARSDRPHHDIPYTDQRAVATQPASPGERAADVVVCLECVDLPPGVDRKDVPEQREVVSSAETLATFGTPFYCTVRVGERRVELGGKVTRLQDHYRISFQFAHNERLDHRALQTIHELKPGETVNVGWSAAGSGERGSVVLLTVQPLGG